AIGRDAILVVPPSCLTVMQGLYPITSTQLSVLNVTFASAASAASGVRAALRARKNDHTRVVAWAGDGGTADIGIQALSGAIERGEDFLYICYDNEAYMNTGIQRSGATPFGAWTTTTPVGRVEAGKGEYKKDIPRIMIAHDAPYVATATLGFIPDLLKKLEKAKNKKGCFRYLQIYAPCPPGWRMDSSLGAKISKMVVDTGLWTLYEFEDGKMTINRKPKMTPVEDYLKLQGRFRHLTKENIATLQKYAEEKWRKDQALAEAYS
ncbi:MAG: thiamine pyrophosphate-dependent enzyme, partial [Candidatus Thermoplasmatota archaeon]|nr:thiamine pyrophosphate-dependent enzyme [Candidatus Thermoplasmatota archaeon]